MSQIHLEAVRTLLVMFLITFTFHSSYLCKGSKELLFSEASATHFYLIIINFPWVPPTLFDLFMVFPSFPLIRLFLRLGTWTDFCRFEFHSSQCDVFLCAFQKPPASRNWCCCYSQIIYIGSYWGMKVSRLRESTSAFDLGCLHQHVHG